MKKELDDLLCITYPRFFSERHLSKIETCMCWGLSCGDGWFDLVDALCREIAKHDDALRSLDYQPVICKQVKKILAGFLWALN